MEVKNPLADFGRRQDHRPPPFRPRADTATQLRKIKQLDGNLPNTEKAMSIRGLIWSREAPFMGRVSTVRHAAR